MIHFTLGSNKPLTRPITDEEILGALNVALVIGDSITIPHIRRAIETLDECRKLQKEDPRLESLL